MPNINTLTKGHLDVYGEAFSLYQTSLEDYNKFIDFFKNRFKANHLDIGIFKDKLCLDAGCGSGRASAFMLNCSAKKVFLLDSSSKNISTSRYLLSNKGFFNTHFMVGDVLNLPYKDEIFDIVWCNGVLHHTENTDRGLCEITRVLKKNGFLWLYLYGDGGIEWGIVDFIRNYLLRGIPFESSFYFLQLIENNLGYISELLDNWYTPYIWRYSQINLEKHLTQLGYTNIRRLMKDVYPRKIDPTLKPIRGEQDLRYWVRKKNSKIPMNSLLPDYNNKESKNNDSSEVKNILRECHRLNEYLLAYENKSNHTDSFLRIAIARMLNGSVMQEIDNPEGFIINNIYNKVLNAQRLILSFNEMNR
jgi:ubiquinone/menaquinone biosynthesis C-methylase UbiE